LTRPLIGGRDECFLHRVLARREVTKAPDQRAEHVRRNIAQQKLDALVRLRRRHDCFGAPLMTSRTSIQKCSMSLPSAALTCAPGAVEISAAISYARSGLSTSIIQ